MTRQYLQTLKYNTMICYINFFTYGIRPMCSTLNPPLVVNNDPQRNAKIRFGISYVKICLIPKWPLVSRSNVASSRLWCYKFKCYGIRVPGITSNALQCFSFLQAVKYKVPKDSLKHLIFIRPFVCYFLLNNLLKYNHRPSIKNKRLLGQPTS